jgi:hypothetical protein
MMDKASPPPYSVRDPHTPVPAPDPDQPNYPLQGTIRDITAFDAFVESPYLIHGLPTRQSSGSSAFPAHYTTPAGNLSGSPSFEELAHAGFVSAQPYFELRLPVFARPKNTLYHYIKIGPDSRPRDYSFPQPTDKWRDREIDDQDWVSFLNHVFPPHVERHESGIVEAQENDEMSYSAFGRPRTLHESRPLLGTEPRPSTEEPDREKKRLRQARIEAVVLQWNYGFFRPRGLEIVLEDINSVLPNSAPNIPRKQPPLKLEDTLLHRAVRDRKKSHVKLLLEKGGENLEAINSKGETVLYKAVSRGDKDIVKLLLDGGADPTSRPSHEADPPLHVAVSNDRKSILKMLLETSRVGIDEPNAKDETPLYIACRRRLTSCIEILLEHGANPNWRPYGQESMLNMSVSSDYKSIAKILLQKGVDVEEKNKGGETVRALN